VSDLSLSVAEVRELGERLRFVAAEFESAEDIAADYAEQVCHDDLAHELEQFAENWRVHRSRLMEDLHTLARHARAAADAYDGVEQALVDALEGEG
jgi:hypothetical protein